MRFTIGLLLTALFCQGAQAELIDDVYDRGELRIAVEANTPQYNFMDAEKPAGFEIELGQELARELDVRAEFVVVEDDLLQDVVDGKFDIALNQLVATPALKERLDFSEPYSQQATAGNPPVNLAIAYQKGNPAFHSAVDNALQRIKADGRLAAMTQKWLSADASQAAKP